MGLPTWQKCAPACFVCLYAIACVWSDWQQKRRQHPDFPGGHPPEYYPSLRLLNFAERTGYGVLSLRWPSTNVYVAQRYICLPNMSRLTHKNAIFSRNMSEQGELCSGKSIPHLILPGAPIDKKLRLVNYDPTSVIYHNRHTTSPPKSPTRHLRKISTPATTSPPTVKLRQNMSSMTPHIARYHQPELYIGLAKLTALMSISPKTHQNTNTLLGFHGASYPSGWLYPSESDLPRAKRISAIRSTVHEQSTF